MPGVHSRFGELWSAVIRLLVSDLTSYIELSCLQWIRAASLQKLKESCNMNKKIGTTQVCLQYNACSLLASVQYTKL